MKLLRRSPREVYRVYDEEEFLVDSGREIASAPAVRGRLTAFVGGIALLVGAWSVFGGLLTSTKRTPRADPRAKRDGPAKLATTRFSTSHESHDEMRSHLARAVSGRPRGASATARARVRAVSAKGRRDATLRRRRPAVTPETSAGYLVAMRRPNTEEVRHLEFGFER